MGCAKHADNPLIHKPTHCYAIIWAVNGGGEKISSLNAISVCSLSLYVCLSSLLDFTYFPHNSGSHFIFFPFFFTLHELWTLFLSHSLHPSLSSTGATVLLVNATDLDASREFGQASLIYSLEGSSQFRLNSRSGVCVCSESILVIETEFHELLF